MPEKCALSHASGVLGRDPRDSCRFWSPHVEKVCTVTQFRLGERGGGIPLGGGGSANREPGSYIRCRLLVYIYIHIYTHTHIHTNIYIYMYIHMREGLVPMILYVGAHLTRACKNRCCSPRRAIRQTLPRCPEPLPANSAPLFSRNAVSDELSVHGMARILLLGRYRLTSFMLVGI